MTLYQTLENAVQVLKDNAAYLQIDAKKIEPGLIGEDADDVFVTEDLFIRVYVQMQPLPEQYANHVDKKRRGSLTAICGLYDNDTDKASKESFELAERIERLLVSKGLDRESTQIFTLKNEGGVSIHGVPFYFRYTTAAGDPNA